MGRLLRVLLQIINNDLENENIEGQQPAWDES